MIRACIPGIREHDVPLSIGGCHTSQGVNFLKTDERFRLRLNQPYVFQPTTSIDSVLLFRQ